MMKSLTAIEWEYAGLAVAVIGAVYLAAMIVMVLVVIAREPRRYWGLGALLTMYLFIVFLGAPSAMEQASAREPTSIIPVLRTGLAAILLSSVAYYVSHFRDRERRVEEEVKEGKR